MRRVLHGRVLAAPPPRMLLPLLRCVAAVTDQDAHAGWTWQPVITGIVPSRVVERDTVMASPGIRMTEGRIRHKHGHWVRFETTSHTVRDPGNDGILAIQTSARDFSAGKQAEARLRESEQR